MAPSPAPTHHDVSVAPGMRLHYLDWGGHADPTALFLHGGTLSSRSFDRMCTLLRPSLRCLAIDLRGHGRSDWSSELAYRSEDYATDVQGFCEVLDIRRTIVVAHSMGGLAAIVFAARPASPASALILLDIVPAVDREGSSALVAEGGGLFHQAGLDDVRSFESLDDAVLLATQRLPHLAATGWRRRFARALQQEPDGRWYWRYDPRRYRPGVHDGPDEMERLLPLATRIHCPTLVVRGGTSTVLTEERAAAFVERVPTAALTTIPGVGHMIPRDASDAAVARIRAFLRAHDVM